MSKKGLSAKLYNEMFTPQIKSNQQERFWPSERQPVEGCPNGFNKLTLTFITK